MIHDFAATSTTEAVVKKELNLAPAEFDKQFLAWLSTHTKKTVDGYEEWRTKIKTLAQLAEEKKYDEIIKTGIAIRDLYPDFVEGGNVYVALANAYIAKDDKAAALDQLERYSRIGGRDPGTIKKLATMLEAANRPKDAAQALERLNYIAPIDPDLHKRLGGLLLAQNDNPGAIREFAAVVAAKPLDQAGAHYDLARAYAAAKENDKAREQVELSLEAAPTFKPAQKLLLQLSPETSK
jgi:tetratricopeptide (TPR) repeat protein